MSASDPEKLSRGETALAILLCMVGSLSNAFFWSLGLNQVLPLLPFPVPPVTALQCFALVSVFYLAKALWAPPDEGVSWKHVKRSLLYAPVWCLLLSMTTWAAKLILG